jgi:hypothetical protein
MRADIRRHRAARDEAIASARSIPGEEVPNSRLPLDERILEAVDIELAMQPSGADPEPPGPPSAWAEQRFSCARRQLFRRA